MELLIMLAIGATTLCLIWLIVREPVKISVREARVSKELFAPRVTEVSEFTLNQLRAETAQEVRVNAGIPRGTPVVAKSQQKPVDKPKAKTYSGSSGSSSRSSSRSSDDSSYSSYSSWGGDSSSSSSSSCDSSSSSSSSSSCD
uniref:Uncharacterized protein n=2 Tax=unclassified bacterial viruses TaxID=12333 RepID=A0AAU6VYE1_9VIRU